MKTVQLAGEPSPAKSWLRALELTAPIANSPQRIFPSVIDELAEKCGAEGHALNPQNQTAHGISTKS